VSTYDAPNQQVVRADGSGPADEGSGGPAEAEATAEPKLPGTHAALDDLAAERGYEWSEEGLTVAQKQAELGG
jgi:hypothetical protein